MTATRRLSGPRQLSKEDQLIDWLRPRVPGGALLGDDTAQLTGLGSIVVSIDQQIADTHFPAALDPMWLARRLLEVCLSDLAASAAHPRFGFLALAAPADWEHRRFFLALGRACEMRGIELAGGDTARADNVSLSMCVIGDRPSGGRFVTRSTARAGDRLWVGGPLGSSALGRLLVERGAMPEGRKLRLPSHIASPATMAKAARAALKAHLAPQAQLDLGRWLGRRRRTAAIDVSDGLALDLARLCKESGVGAVLDPSALPFEPTLRPLAKRLGAEPLDLCLGGGEDYVLLFALPSSVSPPTQFECLRVGRITEEPELRLEGADDELLPLGWSHL